MLRVAIVDDDELVRRSLKMLIDLEDDMKVIKTGKDGSEAIEIMKDDSIDCLLLDMRMPKMDGIEALSKIKNKDKVLILSTFDEEKYIVPAIKLGAKGYILKNLEPTQIIEAIRNVKNKVSIYQDEALDVFRKKIKTPNKENIFFELSDREISVCKLIAEGLNNKEIAKNLYLSEGTVKNYISSILNKTSLEHRTQIAIHYLKDNY